MSKLNSQGYVERRNGRVTRNSWGLNWFIVRSSVSGLQGRVTLGPIAMPQHLIGKRVRIKVEVENEKQTRETVLQEYKS